MKRLMLIIMLLSAGTFATFAQKTDKKEMTQERKEKIFNAKVKMIQEQLLLSPEQTEKFIPIYKNYLTQVFALKRPEKEPKITTSDEAYKYISTTLATKKSILSLQEACVGDLKNILTPQQLMKFLKVENAMQHKIRAEQSRRNSKHHKGHPNAKCTRGERTTK